MKISQKGINLIKNFEGLKLYTYSDSAGILTIGYGHTKGVQIGDTITQEEAENLLREDIEYFEKAVNNLNLNLNQNQFDALVSFAFNCGTGNLIKLTKNRTLEQIPEHIEYYCNTTVNGKKVKLPGLVRRRQAEKELYLSPLLNNEKIDSSYEVYYVNVKSNRHLNVRKEPSSYSEIIGKFASGNHIAVFSITENNWAEVDFQGKRAYVSKRYLEKL